MALLRLNANTDQVRTVSIADLGTATTLALKMRVNGAFLKSGVSTPSASNVLTITGGAARFNALVNFDGTNTQFIITHPPGSPAALAVEPTANIVDGTMYVLYGLMSPTATIATIYLDDGTLVATASAGGATLMNNGAANGVVALGATSLTGAVGLIDGIGIYSAAPASLFSAPAVGDANLLPALWPFDEGTGTTSANAVEGGEAFGATWTGATWEAGGTWDGPAPASGSLLAQLMANGLYVGMAA